MIRCAIVGATGLVGQTFLKVLEEKNLKIDEYVLLASSKSKGKKVKFNDKEYTVEELNEDSFNNKRFNYALFSAGGSIAKDFAPIAIKNGCTVIDNSSYFRMFDNVPLVIPTVNFDDISHSSVIANPNCSTIQAVSVLKPLNDKYKLKRVVYTTFQAVSGAGVKGINDYIDTKNGLKHSFFPYNITDNCIPQIDVFMENGYTKEELKMIEETKKILHTPDLKVTATCVRVPILNSHSESISIEFENEFKIEDISKLLSNTEGIKVIDDISNNIYPINDISNNTDLVYVGRIRRDFSVKNGINIWVVADNIRVGAATNAVNILEKLVIKKTL